MQMYTFTGGNQVGKSHTMLSTAKILTLLGYNVLLIDRTQSQGLLGYFTLDDEANSLTQFDSPKPIVAEDIEIISGEKALCLNKLNSFGMLNNYDYVFVETNDTTDTNLYDKSKKVFLVCNCDKTNIFRNKTILDSIEEKTKIYIIFNQLMKGKNYRDLIYNILLSNLPGTCALLKNNDVEIPFLENDLLVSYANRIDGRFKLKDYSQEYKQAIHNIVNLITDVDLKDFKKVISSRRF